MAAPDRPAPAAPVLFPYAFSLRTPGGTPLTAAQFQGRVLIVNYWATWSAPSAKVVPHLLALKKKHGDALSIVGLVLGPIGDSPAAQLRSVQIKKAQLGINYPLGLIGDRSEIETQIPEFKGLPTTLVLDKWGRVRAQKVGPTDERSLERLVGPLLVE
jgi:thiol-disulfide isomerase/thioredoxin